MEISINKKLKSTSKKKSKGKKSKKKDKTYFARNDKVPKRPVKWLTTKKRPPKIKIKLGNNGLPAGISHPKPLDWL